jgi:hypothetical protein
MQWLASQSEISDEIIGFHAQQPVEKWLKAVLRIEGNRGQKPPIGVGFALCPPGVGHLPRLREVVAHPQTDGQSAAENLSSRVR